MLPEEQMVLYAVLQDIADELRRIKQARQRANAESTAQSTTNDLKPKNVSLAEAVYTDQENES